MKRPGWRWFCLLLLVLGITLAGQNLWRTYPQGLRASAPGVSPTLSPAPNRPVELISVATPLPSPAQVNPQRLWQFLEAIAQERHSVSQREQARAVLQAQLEQAGWQVQQIPFNNGRPGGTLGVNLVATRPGTQPRAGDVLIGAHYDTVIGSPGADDNGSGVAALLELAHLFSPKTSPAQPRGLRLVFFDLEEEGLLGSFAYASNPANLERLAGVIVLEMLGYTCKTPGCQRIPEGFPVQPPSELGDFIVIVGDIEHQPLLQSFQPPASGQPAILPLAVPFKGALTPYVLRSDHAPFWQKEIGAVMVTDTADFRNPHYHRSSDTPATLDRDFLAATTQLVADATQRLLASSQPLVSP